jgi:transposase-like protein
MAEQKSARGRPSKLDGKLATEIAALLLAGHSTSDVAQTVGVSRRSIASWRRRAWSRDERDAACVQLEQMLWRGRAAALVAQQPRIPSTRLEPLDELLRDLDDGF